MANFFQYLKDLTLSSLAAITQPMRIYLKPSQSLDSSDIIKISAPSTPASSFNPATTTLFCMIQTFVNAYQLKTPYYSHDCTYSAGVFTFTIPRISSGDISSSLYHLITIKTYSGGGLSIPKINTRYEVGLSIEHPSTTVIQTDIVYLVPPARIKNNFFYFILNLK